MIAVPVHIVEPAKLAERHLVEWRRLQVNDPLLQSPFLCPEFVQIAAQFRRNVVVAIAEEQGQPVAFLPMQLRGKSAGPVASPLSDCQAIIATHDWTGDPSAFIQAAGVAVYDFNHQRVDHRLAPYQRSVFPSPVIDLSNGFAAYVAEMRERAHDSEVNLSGRPHQIIKRAKRVEKKYGPLHFTMHDSSAEALAKLIKWKRQQYHDNGTVIRLLDCFSYSWTVGLLRQIQTTCLSNFSGVLSTLRIGDELVAAHIGMRSHDVLHWWFPAYDKRYAKISPGLILLLELCRQAEGSGVRKIELGAGEEAYKGLVANSQLILAAGFIGVGTAPVWFRQLLHGTEMVANRLPIGPCRTWPGRLFRRVDRMRWLSS
jgi:CelD/BcsL family acetyltransferase involved in cellulose biosynthesis